MRERHLLRAEQMAAIGQVAAGVAHELRNPLTSIKGLVQVNLREARPRGLPAEDLRVIEHEIRRMERTLQTFLDFARPPQPDRRRLSLAAVVDRVFAVVGGRARSSRSPSGSSGPTGPVWVEADQDQLQQLLLNLVLNALDAMPGGGVAGDRPPPAAGRATSRSTSATPARGSPRTSCPRCSRRSSAARRPGLGWGCRCRGGSPRTTAAASPPTTCPRAAPASSSACPPRPDAGTGFDHGGAMPTLLVVDDEPSILHFFRRAFPEPEVTLLTASSAAEGLERGRRRPARRGRSWTSTCRTRPGWRRSAAIHEIDPKIPVIFITGHGTTATAIEAMRLGAYEYLLKPLELDHLSTWSTGRSRSAG